LVLFCKLSVKEYQQNRDTQRRRKKIGTHKPYILNSCPYKSLVVDHASSGSFDRAQEYAALSASCIHCSKCFKQCRPSEVVESIGLFAITLKIRSTLMAEDERTSDGCSSFSAWNIVNPNSQFSLL